MVSCSVPGCVVTRRNNPNKHTFHRFPRNSALMEKWMRTINRPDWTPIPPIQKCSLSDSKCITASAQAVVSHFTEGIPELNIKTLDPLEVKSTKVDLSGLKIDVNDGVVSGLKNTIIEKIEVDTTKNNLHLVFHVDISLKGKYKASGKLLILPIRGDGDLFFSTKNIQIIMDMPFDIINNKDSKDVINLKSYKYTYDVRDAATYHLTNLFNGNKELSDNLHKFMNENWKTLSQEFGQPVLEKQIETIYISVKAYLSSLPLEEIANA